MSTSTEFEYKDSVDKVFEDLEETLQNMVADDYHPYDGPFAEETYQTQLAASYGYLLLKLLTKVNQLKA